MIATLTPSVRSACAAAPIIATRRSPASIPLTIAASGMMMMMQMIMIAMTMVMIMIMMKPAMISLTIAPSGQQLPVEGGRENLLPLLAPTPLQHVES